MAELNERGVDFLLRMFGAHPEDFQRRKFNKANPNPTLETFLQPQNVEFLRNPQVRAQLEALLAGQLGQAQIPAVQANTEATKAGTDATRQNTAFAADTRNQLGIPLEGFQAQTARKAVEVDERGLPIAQQRANTESRQVELMGEGQNQRNVNDLLQSLFGVSTFTKDPTAFIQNVIKSAAGTGGQTGQILGGMQAADQAAAAERDAKLKALMAPANAAQPETSSLPKVGGVVGKYLDVLMSEKNPMVWAGKNIVAPAASKWKQFMVGGEPIFGQGQKPAAQTAPVQPPLQNVDTNAVLNLLRRYSQPQPQQRSLLAPTSQTNQVDLMRLNQQQADQDLSALLSELIKLPIGGKERK